jgi:hypothetical protein
MVEEVKLSKERWRDLLVGMVSRQGLQWVFMGKWEGGRLGQFSTRMEEVTGAD